MYKQPLEKCSAVFIKVSLKNQRLLYKSVAHLNIYSRTYDRALLRKSQPSTVSRRFQSSSIFTKTSTVDLQLGSKCASASILILINNQQQLINNNFIACQSPYRIREVFDRRSLKYLYNDEPTIKCVLQKSMCCKRLL